MGINIYKNMEEIKNFQEKFKDMTSEQQLSIITNMYMREAQLTNRLRQLEDQLAFKELDYLFKVIEIGTFSNELTKKCEDRIHAIMFAEEDSTSSEHSKE